MCINRKLNDYNTYDLLSFYVIFKMARLADSQKALRFCSSLIEHVWLI